jgi:predicted transcriptional regulator
MMTETVISHIKNETVEDKVCLLAQLEKAEETCRKCNAFSPIICTTQCDVWNLKNEFRQYYEKMTKSSYLVELLNTLKNKRRLEILNILSRRSASLVEIQKNLKNLQCNHSQQTIVKEYLEPLLEVCLITKTLNSYSITLFGYEINELLKGFHEFAETLQPRSKCYEETILLELVKDPKKYEELKTLVVNESLPRVLKRLQRANLISKPDENNYIFYFKTKRNPSEVKLSSTEKRIYENISSEGSTAKALADRSNITLRRTYKYLKRLRGKKLVFKRKNPKTYTLTLKGIRIAKLIEEVNAATRKFKEASIALIEKPVIVQKVGTTRKRQTKLSVL